MQKSSKLPFAKNNFQNAGSKNLMLKTWTSARETTGAQLMPLVPTSVISRKRILTKPFTVITANVMRASAEMVKLVLPKLNSSIVEEK